MPLIEEQLPLLRALWLGSLVCCKSLYCAATATESAKTQDVLFDYLRDIDATSCAHLACNVTDIYGEGRNTYRSINNKDKAEECAPLSVIELVKNTIINHQLFKESMETFL